MANALALFNGNVIADVEVSSKQSETHAFRTTVTEYPIQNGAIANDHAFTKPFELDVAFMAANTPGPGLTAQQVFDAFKTHSLNRDLLKVVTENASYENMLIVDFQPMHKSPNKGALECTIKFEQLNFVLTSTVPYLNAVDTSAQSVVNRGFLAPVLK